MSDFDQLLELIAGNPGMARPPREALAIPEVDFTQVVPERIY